MLFISPILTSMAKGKIDGMIEGNKKKTPELIRDLEKEKEIIRKLSENKIKLNK